jgi:hypothetical protein
MRLAFIRHTRGHGNTPPLPPLKKDLPMKSMSVFLIASTLAISACATTTPGTGGDNPPVADSCNADGARSSVGKVATPEVVEQARRDAGAEVARVLKPGQMVTMEYREGRLNIDVDANNVIKNVRCG